MTIVVALLCNDGVVVASDSRISYGTDLGMASGPGKKIEILSGKQIFASAGNVGLGARFGFIADQAHAAKKPAAHRMEYHRLLHTKILEEFRSTGLVGPFFGLDAVLAYAHDGAHHCCIFDGFMQYRSLDQHNFYTSIGSGYMSANFFLHFLTGVFCKNSTDSDEVIPPSVDDGITFAVWTINHVIETNVGGVGPPIRVGTLQRNDQNTFEARELLASEIPVHLDAIRSMLESMPRLLSGRKSTHAPAAGTRGE